MKRTTGSATSPNWIGLAASGLALASCYGTMAVVVALSAAGMALDIDEGTWAAAIAFFAFLSVAAIAFGMRRHGHVWPAVLAALGFGLIVWVLFWNYVLTVEIFGFAALVGAAVWDWRLRRTIPNAEVATSASFPK